MNSTDVIAAMLECTLDPACVLDHEGRIIACNPLMRNFLKLKPRELLKRPIFCDLVKLSICKEQCQIIDGIHKKKIVRADESPSSLGVSKYRLTLKGTPYPSNGNPGMILTLRDTSAETILQAKYHKLQHLLEEEKRKNEDMRERMRRSAMAHLTK